MKTKKFPNILCCINFNFPYYQNIPFLKEFYGDLFDLAFYGPGETNDPNVIRIEHHEGYYSYRVILDAMERFPNYDGYMFLHDDCIFNSWNAFNLNTSKIWIPVLVGDLGEQITIIFLDNDESYWPWWQNHEEIRQNARKAFHQLPEKYKTQLKQNIKANNAIAINFSDFFYLPRQYAEDFKSVFSISSSNDLFLEIAVPTGLLSISPYEDMEQVSCIWNPIQMHTHKSKLATSILKQWLPQLFTFAKERKLTVGMKAFFSADLVIYHPIKLSSIENREFIEKRHRLYQCKNPNIFVRLKKNFIYKRLGIILFAYYLIEEIFKAAKKKLIKR